MNPKYPIYIISKGRWENPLTVKSLERMKVPYRIVIEPQEFEKYSKIIDESKILILPFSNLGQGSIPARNWVWEHSIEEGHDKHWILDDNIRDFYRLNRNIKWRMDTGTNFLIVEDFVNRYENIKIAGMQYEMFVPRIKKCPPYVLNTRIYSCILIDNSLEFKWRGKYNEDTDLSIRTLKAGYCTILFNVFLCDKIHTMTMKGGNTDELYSKTNNRREFAESLKDQHPDIVEVVWKFNRWHHQVDYSQFKNNKLILKEGLKIENKINNYDMELVNIK